MEHRNLTEIFSNEARIQLSFSSYMKMAALICFGVTVTATVFIVFLGGVTYVPGPEEASFPFWLTIYILFGSFLLGMAGAAITYPVYMLLCEKNKGQFATGKFAVLVNGSNKSLKNGTPESGAP